MPEATLSQTLKLAAQLHQDGSLTQAQQIYQQILQQQPQNLDALHGLGSLALKQGNLPDAEQLFLDALSIQPQDLKTWFSLGNLYYAQTKLPEAEQCYLKVIELQPNLVSVYNNLGYVQQLQDKFPEAVSSYQKALDLQPNCIEAELNLATVLHHQGELSQDKQVYYAVKYNDLGVARKTAGDLATAITYYQQAIALQPQLAIAHYNLGGALQAQQKLEPALTCFQKALELKPKAADFHHAAANVLQHLDRYDDARDHYYQAMKLRYSQQEIIQHSLYDNIYYCCTQKTASQWFRSIFNDPIVYKYTGLVTRPYVQLGLKYASFNNAPPPGTIETHLYVDYPTYLSIPKPGSYQTFFVLRDPRDAVVSWYFSAKYSHVLTSIIPELRRNLAEMDLNSGLKYIIDRLQEFGYFEAQRSWKLVEGEQQNIAIFRYEDLVDSNSSFLRKLFHHLSIEIPETEFIDLCERNKFEAITKGRVQGEENINSHYRKGISGDWKNYFDNSTLDYFHHVTGNLIEILGYEGSGHFN
ncbi:MAG: tetratricopeptide repeat protein [Cyanobacteria bacterium P01_G01_bin.39]